MSITAKSDILTLYIQLLMFFELLCFFHGERPSFFYALGAFFFSWTLKPTAMVFSSAVMGMSFLYLPWMKTASPSPALIDANGKRRRTRTRKGRAELPGSRQAALITFFLSLLALTGLWARTFFITGLPVTSVFSSVLTRIGFPMNYPFCAKSIPNNNAGISIPEILLNMFTRLYGVLFNPQGKDLDHVIIAWGSLSTWFFLCSFLCWIFLDKKKRTENERRLDGYFQTVFLPLLACCLISLTMLYQVDGNYFMLFYVLSVLCAFRLVERLASQRAARFIHALSIPVILFSIVITTLTNWAWAMGFTPISWAHRGYYPHQEENYRIMAESGNGQIWEILAQNPRNRLISFGDHPQSLLFPCCAQTYHEIAKSAWGNPELVKNADNFTEFLAYAKTDYIYAQADYISLKNPAWNLLCDLINSGILTPLCYEEGNMLAYVDVNGKPDENTQERFIEFKENYNAWTEEDEDGISSP